MYVSSLFSIAKHRLAFLHLDARATGTRAARTVKNNRFHVKDLVLRGALIYQTFLEGYAALQWASLMPTAFRLVQ